MITKIENLDLGEKMQVKSFKHMQIAVIFSIFLED